jgi:predicted nucleic acid-binding protein
MSIPKIYLETTMFNYYFDADRDAHADTVALFEECQIGLFEAFTSDYVLREIDNDKTAKRDEMRSLIKKYDIKVLAATEETDSLAKRYTDEGALPKGSFADACHIAATAVYGLDMIVSLNFRHIVRDKTMTATSEINALSGYKQIKIYAPMEVINREKS